MQCRCMAPAAMERSSGVPQLLFLTCLWADGQAAVRLAGAAPLLRPQQRVDARAGLLVAHVQPHANDHLAHKSSESQWRTWQL